MTQVMRHLFCVLLLSTAVLADAFAATGVDEQRQWFAEARVALQGDDLEQFYQLKEKLADYPLTPYLEIWQAWKMQDEGNDLDVPQVLAQHADIPEAFDLRLARIKDLAKRGQWPHVAAELAQLSRAEQRLPEISMLSLWYSGEKKEALRRFSEQWQDGYNPSDGAVSLERQWQALGHPSRHEVWERIGSLIHRGDWRSVRQLETKLSKQERKWVNRWQEMQRNPQVELAKWKANGTQAIPQKVARRMVDDALQRLSRNDALAAWSELQRLKKMFESKGFRKLEQRIALRGAGQHLPVAAVWLADLPADMQTEKTRGWRIRLHLLDGHWAAALAAMEMLPAAERGDSRWSYWQARALTELGRADEAQALYQLTATGRGFYSFLSAERLSLPYHLGASELVANPLLVQELEQRPAIVRAREWLLLGEEGKASREWSMALGGASIEEWKAASVLAASWQWHNHVIQAAYRAGETDALKWRFPIAFEQEVATACKETGLPPSLVWSVIRQESAFNSKAVSSAGAKGLMQLMGATAREVARNNNISNGMPDLFDPAVNIQIGTLYLNKMLERFNRNHAIATAAYNAGPNRVAGWLERRAFEEADVWIEAIPFEETRRYVQQAMAFTVVYDWRQAHAPAGIATQIAPPKPEAKADTLPNKRG